MKLSFSVIIRSLCQHNFNTNPCYKSWSKSHWVAADLSCMASLCHREQPGLCDKDHAVTVFHKAIISSILLLLFAAVIWVSTLYTYTHTHLFVTALCPGLPGWAGTRKVNQSGFHLKQETVSGSGISWAICKSAPRSRQITTPAPRHSTGRIPFLPPNQQRQSTEGNYFVYILQYIYFVYIYSKKHWQLLKWDFVTPNQQHLRTGN